MPDEEGEEHKKGRKLSRREELEKQELEVAMPECDAQYILDHLFSIGITLGDSAVTHGEIESYQNNIGIRLNPWEILTIKRLSETYLSELHKAREVNAKTAWQDAPDYMSLSYRCALRSKAAVRKLAEL